MNIFKSSTLGLVLAAIGAAGISATPAAAQDRVADQAYHAQYTEGYHHHHFRHDREWNHLDYWRHHEWRRHEWRDHRWSDHGWRDHRDHEWRHRHDRHHEWRNY